MDDKTIYFNGLDATTGGYTIPPMPLYRLARMIRGEAEDPDLGGKGVKALIDACDFSQAGWGVVFAHDTPEAVRAALAPLIEHRRAQAEALIEGRFQELIYLPGESKLRFLARHGAGPGLVDPDHVPYYLLLVGGPQSIPFAFQYQLGVQYAVGRLDFDTPAEYARYAQSVLEAEARPLRPAARVALWGVCNPDDPLTRLSVDHLVAPLARDLAASLGKDRVTTIAGEEATKPRLAAFLGGEQTPDLLFTASHGVCFRSGDPSQLGHQGGLVGTEWPGPMGWKGRLHEDHFFAADDVADDARLAGLVSCHFACFTAGTPRFRTFATADESQAPAPFAARLPRRLLGHPKGGTLAVIGHVDLAWQHSFVWDDLCDQTQTFESALLAIASGQPVGKSMEAFSSRHAELASDSDSDQRAVREGITAPTDEEVCRTWTAYQDARSYVLFGDPAVRLPIVPPQKESSDAAPLL